MNVFLNCSQEGAVSPRASVDLLHPLPVKLFTWVDELMSLNPGCYLEVKWCPVCHNLQGICDGTFFCLLELVPCLVVWGQGHGGPSGRRWTPGCSQLALFGDHSCRGEHWTPFWTTRGSKAHPSCAILGTPHRCPRGPGPQYSSLHPPWPAPHTLAHNPLIQEPLSWENQASRQLVGWAKLITMGTK